MISHTLARLVAVLAIGAGLSGCSLAGGDLPPASTPSVVDYEATLPARTVNSGVCVDPSESTRTEFAGTFMAGLATLAEGWSAAPRTQPGEEIQPRPGLKLITRLVTTRSFDSAAPSLTVAIPPVDGVAPRPDATDPAFASEDPIWRSAASTAAQQADRAAAAAVHAARQLRSMQLVRGRSEIVGCLSALALVVTGEHRTLVLASDLEQNEPAQIAGDLKGVRVLIVQVCDGEAAHCTSLSKSWQRQLEAGGATVTVMRPENASADSLRAFLLEVLR